MSYSNQVVNVAVLTDCCTWMDSAIRDAMPRHDKQQQQYYNVVTGKLASQHLNLAVVMGEGAGSFFTTLGLMPSLASFNLRSACTPFLLAPRVILMTIQSINVFSKQKRPVQQTRQWKLPQKYTENISLIFLAVII
ncbi:hypothetical protein T4B_1493 [Trichinella pseudospiralis]|uniref:Uncharacterized protein n=1 Tax=Trichinella pseudospiralis TaxID=6337 RepID=A0A0V1IC82_TRIPS|nr:hypothetical protein T4B_1493 [Trichinella pseudospiralis]KRZ27317.1 hypothetical protein T4C_7859 [Trichinella pseudospiralis]